MIETFTVLDSKWPLNVGHVYDWHKNKVSRVAGGRHDFFYALL